jgi:hypothetical protein
MVDDMTYVLKVKKPSFDGLFALSPSQLNDTAKGFCLNFNALDTTRVDYTYFSN